MSLYINKSSKSLRKLKDCKEKEVNQFKINWNNNTKSLNQQKMNNFFKNNNKYKYNTLFKNKSNLLPKVINENINISKIKKNFNNNNYIIDNNPNICSNPFLKENILKNKRNNKINLNNMNHFNSIKETCNSNSNRIYNRTYNNNNNIFNIKKNNIKKNFYKYISFEKKNNKNDNIKLFKSHNTLSLKEKINCNNKKFQYHSDKKKPSNLFNRFINNNQNPLKLFLNKKNFSDLEDSSFMPNNKNDLYINNDIKKYNSTLKDYCCRSDAGTDILGNKKINQDSYLTLLNVGGLQNYSVFAIFDGHGINGHLVSKFLKNFFQNYFTNIDRNEDIDNFNENIIFQKLLNEQIIKAKFKLLENFLLEKPFSIQYSGSTCIIIIYIEDKILCYNIGDSRAVYINNNFQCIPISKDHKPEIPKEKLRIEENGGIVKRDYLGNGVYRVWSKNGKYPGLAMSRSIGDYVAKSLGVINEPDFYEINVTNNNIKSIIIGSDGLWDVLNNNLIEKIVEEYIIKDDCVGCVNTLIDEAKKIYNKKNISCDDITVIVIFFEIKK